MPPIKLKGLGVKLSGGTGGGGSAPTGFQVEAMGTGTQLMWDIVPGATSYKIYRNTINNFLTSSLIQNYTVFKYGDVTKYYTYDSGRASQATYYYFITSVTSGVESLQAMASVTMGKFYTGLIPGGTAGSPANFFNGATWDLNTQLGLTPGIPAVIILDSGTNGYYGTLDFEGLYNDITITSPATGVTTITGRLNFGSFGQHAKLVGNLATDHGIYINSGLGGYFGSSCRTTGNVRYINLNLVDNFMGLQIETRVRYHANFASFPATGFADVFYKALDTGNFYTWNTTTLIYEASPNPIPLDYQNVIVSDCISNGTGQEAFYFGADYASYIQMDGIVRYCDVDDCGRDGIQCRNGRWTIIYNLVGTTGLNGEDAHGHGILVGGNGGGTQYIIGNTVVNARNYAIFSNTYGVLTVRGNTAYTRLDSCFFTKNYESNTEDLMAIGFQRFVLQSNDFDTGDSIVPLAIDIKRDPVKCPVTVDYYGATLIVHGKGIWIEDGVTRGGVTPPNNGVVVNNL